MSDVFISHVEHDADTTLEIAQGLEGARYSTWYYERDSVPGPSYLLQTGQAIEDCQVVVLLITRRSLGSHQVTREVERAHECGKRIIPVRGDLTHAEFQNLQPEWRQAVGAAASIRIGRGGPSAIIAHVTRGLEALGVQPSLPPARAPETVPTEPPPLPEAPAPTDRVPQPPRAAPATVSRRPRRRVPRLRVPAARIFRWGALPVLLVALIAFLWIALVPSGDDGPPGDGPSGLDGVGTPSAPEPRPVLPPPEPPATEKPAVPVKVQAEPSAEPAPVVYVSKEVCSVSAKLATTWCPRPRKTQRFAEGSVPGACTVHIAVRVCTATGKKSTADCPKTTLRGFPRNRIPNPCTAHTPKYVEARVCAESGQVPRKWCPQTIQKRFLEGKEPTQQCSVHDLVEQEVCPVTGKLARADCPAPREKKLFKREELPPLCPLHKPFAQ